MSNNIYIIGAGGHGQVVLDALLKSGISPAGFLDDNISHGKKVSGITVLGNITLAKELKVNL